MHMDTAEKRIADALERLGYKVDRENQTAEPVFMKIEELQKRYDILFEMYVEHIHEHRLGVGKTCDDCIRLANEEIENRLKL